MTTTSDELANKYQQKTDKQHILDNPDTYIGSVEKVETDLWILNDDQTRIVEKNISYIPALFKLFDEGIVNCRDHVIRMQQAIQNKVENALPVNYIDISIQDDGTITMMNDGNGIDIAEHPEYKIWIPELIFGHLRTSTNYDKTEKKIVGGKNGFGFKLVLIWSTYGSVETVDHVRGLKYVQEFKNNLDIIEKPKITKCKTKPYTKIVFKPDYARLGITGLTPDIISLLKKRVYDVAAVTDKSLKVKYNSNLIPVKNFQQYIDLYIGAASKEVASSVRAYEDSGERWEYAVALSPTHEFIQVSFVNGIHTAKGGKHVEYILGQITRKLVAYIEKKKKVVVNANSIKEQLILFLRCDIENPAFDSQTKDFMNTPSAKFGSTCTVSDKFIEKIAKMGVMDAACALTEVKENKAVKKTDGSKTKSIRGIPKLIDANWAGTEKSAQCSIIFCEGDSAKAGIVSGLSSEDRNVIGVYPMKGKILNVRGEQTKKIAENKEIAEIKKILGLESGRVYKNAEDVAKTLRYGKVLFMTDQDSVTGDTPLFLKNLDQEVEIRTIDNISNTDWSTTIFGKDESQSSYQIWTEKGWTDIRRVIRHKVSKRIFRILTHTGIVDVTEDHSLILDNNEEISPKDVKINDRLLHSFPTFWEEKYNMDEIKQMTKTEILKLSKKLKISYYCSKTTEELLNEIEMKIKLPNIEINIKDYGICDKEAYVMGLFWADGTCGVYNWKYNKKPHNRPNEYTFNRTSYCWSICNTNLDYLNKAKEYIHEIYDYEFKIIQCDVSKNKNSKTPVIYKLVLNGGKKSSSLIEKYRDLFYDDSKNKKIPVEILNSKKEIREEFFQGFYDGDGCKYSLNRNGSKFFDVNGKIGSHGLFLLCKSIGYSVSINVKPEKPKVYTLTLTKGYQQSDPFHVKKIIDLGITEQFVYDLETDNHHFQAGVGQMIVHNTDGSHIKGLGVNLFQSEWGSLVQIPGFIGFMNTPILKARKGTQELVFYNEGEYETWKNANAQGKGWNVKYYKGLGTSTGKEFREYFEKKKTVNFEYNGKDSDDKIDMVFNKKRADDRKLWLGEYNRDSYLNTNDKMVTYEEFINKELIHFSKYDCDRSIPNLMDGLKISLRKILYSAFKKNLTTEIKVAQFSGYVSEHSGYHHGEASLNAAIVGMAQNFVGSNNINLLMPNGQFGTRLQGGKDSASERYIFTQLNKITRHIFPEMDDNILSYLNDDGMLVEPIFYAPIIPMVLVNGSKGIGTGFSTDIMCYNPSQIIQYIRGKLSVALAGGGALPGGDIEFVPYYEGFQGTIQKVSDEGKYLFKGKYEKMGVDKIRVTELPVGYWTDDFKEYLEGLTESVDKTGKKIVPVVKEYDDMSKDTSVDFIITLQKGKLAELEAIQLDHGCNGVEKQFKLFSTNNSTNMHLFDSNDKLKKYDRVQDIIDDYFVKRLELYQKRKDYMVDALSKELLVLSNKSRYIRELLEGTIDFRNKKKEVVIQMLNDKKYSVMNDDTEFKYLTKLPLDSVTEENVERLNKEHADKLAELDYVKTTSTCEMWLKELDVLEKEYVKMREGAVAKVGGAAKVVSGGAEKKKIIKK